jgi:hypothetical protein
MKICGIRTTREIRWFLPGEPPDAVAGWFRRWETSGPRARTDRYLMIPGCDSVGVKERDDTFEIKARIGEPQRFVWGEAISGAAERWSKWARKGEGTRAFLAALDDEPENWLPVRKSRSQWKFPGKTGRGAGPFAGIADIPSGLAGKLEFTRIDLAGRHWWSVALEVDDPDGGGLDALHLAGEIAFAGAPTELSLPESASLSYPAWIDREARHPR